MMKINNIAAILIWVFYGLVTGCCVFLVAMSAGTGLGYGFLPGFAAGMAILILLGPIALLVHRTGQKLLSAAVSGGRRFQLVTAEILLLIVCLAGMTFLRLVSAWNVETDPVFEMAKVTAGGFSPVVAHRGAEMYLYLLHGAMLLVGNKASAAVFLQLLLCVCAALAWYFGIRRLCGVTAAFVTILFLGFAPYMLAETKRLTPLLLFLIFYGAALYCIGAISNRVEARRKNRLYLLLRYLAAGLLTGFCLYLDVAGISLFIFLTGVICFDAGHSEYGENGVLAFLCCLLSAGLSYAGAHGIRSLGGGSLINSIYGQMELYLPGDFHIPVTTTSGAASFDVPVLAVLMAVGVYGFWFSRRIRDKGMWLFAAVLLMGMQCFGICNTAYFDGYGLLYLFCSAMAGCSVSDLFVIKQESAGTQEPDAAGLADLTGTPDEMEMISLDIPESNLNSSSDAANEIHFIENPLPLPKKKVHRVLDYDYEVADDDDFDIQ